MDLRDYDYYLPEKLIAQFHAEPRHYSRLLHFDSKSGSVKDAYFFNLVNLLKKGDVLVFNNSKVIPARLRFFWKEKEAEVLFIREQEEKKWIVIGKPGKMLKVGQKLNVDSLEIEILRDFADGTRLVEINFNYSELQDFLLKFGEMPLPPYIHQRLANSNDYQTVYSAVLGSVAAPTAGLHFTKELLSKLQSQGVELEFVTLHVGLGTFLPIKTNQIENHHMHQEYFHITAETAKKLNKAKTDKKRIIAVGTTSARVLESAYDLKNGFIAQKAQTGIFIKPGYQWKAVDALITNFHLPKSTLLLLISALAGREKIFKVYEHAIRYRYRFYSFGDAMFIE